jgi:ribosomal protein S18 acetylase RimI-like enzyme
MKGDRFELTDLAEIRDLLFRARAIRLRVTGWSMYPTLWPGDRLTAELVFPAHLRVGDVLLIHHRGRVICHRLIAIQETGADPRLVTKGDGQSGRGDMTRPDQVLGRVVAVRRRWPWARRIRWAGALAMRLNRARERLTNRIVRMLEHLQGVRGYRAIMRSMLFPSFRFYFGVAEGQRWVLYRRIGDQAQIGHHPLHLMAKVGGSWAGSVRVTPRGNRYWIDDLYVRRRYRGMGVGSKLLALTATAASKRGPAVLLASVEAANTVALDVFTKAGYRETPARDGNAVCLRRDLHEYRRHSGPGMVRALTALAATFSPAHVVVLWLSRDPKP